MKKFVPELSKENVMGAVTIFEEFESSPLAREQSAVFA